MLLSRAIGIIVNTSSLVANWPYDASLKPFKFNFRLGNSYYDNSDSTWMQHKDRMSADSSPGLTVAIIYTHKLYTFLKQNKNNSWYCCVNSFELWRHCTGGFRTCGLITETSFWLDALVGYTLWRWYTIFFLNQSAFDQCAVLNRTNDCASALSFSVRSLFRSVQSDLDK